MSRTVAVAILAAGLAGCLAALPPALPDGPVAAPAWQPGYGWLVRAGHDLERTDANGTLQRSNGTSTGWERVDLVGLPVDGRLVHHVAWEAEGVRPSTLRHNARDAATLEPLRLLATASWRPGCGSAGCLEELNLTVGTDAAAVPLAFPLAPGKQWSLTGQVTPDTWREGVANTFVGEPVTVGGKSYATFFVHFNYTVTTEWAEPFMGVVRLERHHQVDVWYAPAAMRELRVEATIRGANIQENGTSLPFSQRYTHEVLEVDLTPGPAQTLESVVTQRLGQPLGGSSGRHVHAWEW
ncbi:MAG TPA: hypothetical protein VFH47_01515 [Candidatus Thermoplasmatota archaeon]|nr:hypothetical protein [Candidatus Thermoplasmatota archaeon]